MIPQSSIFTIISVVLFFLNIKNGFDWLSISSLIFANIINIYFIYCIKNECPLFTWFVPIVAPLMSFLLFYAIFKNRVLLALEGFYNQSSKQQPQEEFIGNKSL
jgi:hypothetical protein